MGKASLSTCVAFQRPRSAAVFFDRVVPFNCYEFLGKGIPPVSSTFNVNDLELALDRIILDGMMEHREIIAELLFGTDYPGSKIVEESIHDLFDVIYDVQSKYRVKDPNSSTGRNPAFYNAQYVIESGMYHDVQQVLTASCIVNNEVTIGNRVPSRDRVSNFVERYLGGGFCFYLPTDILTQETGPHQILVDLSDLPLIDERTLDWQNIIELRRDPAARRRLLRLEEFAIDLMKALSTSDISFRDKLEVKLDDHLMACREYGIGTSKSVIQAVFDPKSIISAAGLTAVAPMVGGDTMSGLLAGGTMWLANFMIQVHQANVLNRKYVEEQPLSFLSKDLSLRPPQR